MAAQSSNRPPRRRVVVTGTGVVSPLGDSPAELHRALAAGALARKPIELFATEGIGCHEAGEIRPFDPQSYVGERNLRPLDRTSRLLVVAAQLALADSGWKPAAAAAAAADMAGEAATAASAASTASGEAAPTGGEPGQEAEVGLVLGTTFCSIRTIAEFDRRALRLGPAHASPLDFANSVINAAAGQAAIWHRLRGVNSTLAAGEASGLLAIAQAVELLRAGRAAAVLAGGAEELCFESFFGMYRAGRLCGSPARTGARREPGGEGKAPLATAPARGVERPVPFDALRNGFSLSEGAALLMLEDAAAAAARGAVVRAEVLGWGTAFAIPRGGEGAVSAGAAAAGSPDAAVAASPGAAAAAGSGGAGVGAGAGGVAALAEAVARAVRLALADAGTRPDEIGCVSASASGSLEVDRAEALGLAAALGERAVAVPVTAIKAMLGEGLGVSAAWQALDLVETLGDGVLPGIAGLERLESGLPLAGASAATRRLERRERRRALVTAVGADGHCAALVLGSPEAGA